MPKYEKRRSKNGSILWYKDGKRIAAKEVPVQYKNKGTLTKSKSKPKIEDRWGLGKNCGRLSKQEIFAFLRKLDHEELCTVLRYGALDFPGEERW